MLRKNISTIFFLLLTSLVPALALAQQTPLGAIRNDLAASTVQGTNLGTSRLSTDSKGVLYIRQVSGNGLDISNIPISNATGLVGIGTASVAYSRIGTLTVGTGSTTTNIVVTNTARNGDIIYFTTGTAANVRVWSEVLSATGSAIVLVNALPSAPVVSDTCELGRPVALGASPGLNGSLPALTVNADYTSQISSATGLLKLEDNPSANGDAGVAVLGSVNNGLTTKVGTDGDYVVPSYTDKGSAWANLDERFQFTDTLGLLKLEDAAAASGDAGVFALSVKNTGLATLSSTDGDYQAFGSGNYGNLFSTLLYDASAGNTFSPIMQEDRAFPDLGIGIVTFGQSQSAVAQTVGTSGDVAPAALDLGNRTIVTNAPAGETWEVCTSAITTATNTVLKTGVASNRIYITQFNCVQNSTTPQFISVLDGVGSQIIAGYLTSNLTSEGFTRTYPITPLRLSVASNITIQTNAIGSVFCCGSGYISTI